MSAESIKSVGVETPNKVSKLRQWMASILLLACFTLIPAMAMANPIEDGVDWVLELLTDGIARSVAIIGIVILGYLAWMGRITGEACGKYVVGIVLVFGGATIVDLISAAVA